MAAAKLGRLSASYWVAAPAATKPPAEKPSMPRRCGSTPHLRAFCLTVRTACMPSATTIGRTLSIWSRYWCGLAAIRTSAASSSGVGTTRYFSTKAVTPRAVNQRATSVPSFVHHQEVESSAWAHDDASTCSAGRLGLEDSQRWLADIADQP